jgi:hypothetical protein
VILGSLAAGFAGYAFYSARGPSAATQPAAGVAASAAARPGAATAYSKQRPGAEVFSGARARAGSRRAAVAKRGKHPLALKRAGAKGQSPLRVPACDFGRFAAGSEYSAVVTREVDLLGDGTPEWLVGYQAPVLDGVPYAGEYAYFTVVRYRPSARKWETWFTMPALEGEGLIDRGSVVRVGDLNGDGIAEIVLRLYGFGISQRPENVYAYSVTDRGARPASRPFPIPVARGDALVFQDCSPRQPGLEMVLAKGVETRGAPRTRPYRLSVWGWKEGAIGERKTWVSKAAFRDGAAALRSGLGSRASQGRGVARGRRRGAGRSNR